MPPDIVDRAQAADEMLRHHAELTRQAGRPRGESLPHCLECGVEIPEKRREAVPGVRLCIACQQDKEAQGA